MRHSFRSCASAICFVAPPDARAAFEKGAIDAWVIWGPFVAAAELTAVLGLDRSITDLYLDRAVFGTAPITRAILAEQQVIADTFFELKLIPKRQNLLDAAALNTG